MAETPGREKANGERFSVPIHLARSLRFIIDTDAGFAPVRPVGGAAGQHPLWAEHAVIRDENPYRLDQCHLVQYHRALPFHTTF